MAAEPKLDELGISNRSKVFRLIYSKDKISKQEIANELNLSLPTVASLLKELYSLRVICKNGYFESTGGRKPFVISINENAKIAIGVEVLKASVRIVAINLKGKILREEFYKIPFSASDHYYKQLGSLINSFADSLHLGENEYLGVYLAVQGLVSVSGDEIISGDILGYTGTKLDAFQKHINLPCRLFHDTELAAFAELWNQPDIKNAVILVLNQYLGGALIINGDVYQGEKFSGCVIEHMRLIPNGRDCYCRHKGCFNTYCSAYSLEQDSGMKIEDFFVALKNGNKEVESIFNTFLENLALGINNISMVVDCEFIIAGVIEKYLTEEHLQKLSKLVKKAAAFDNIEFHYRHSVHGIKAASRGAALKLISEFLNSI